MIELFWMIVSRKVENDMANDKDLGKMAEYFINKDIESILVNKIKNNLEYLENVYKDLTEYAEQIHEEIDTLKAELHELGVDF